MSITAPTNSSRVQFAAMITEHPIFGRYWNEEEDKLEYQAMKDSLNGLSHGEKIMGHFFLSVWRGDDEGFDFLDAAGTLDWESKRIVMTWFADPFWP